jgi:hypothetical protein
MRRHVLDPLPDVGVVLVEGGVAEHVGGDEDAGGPQLLARLGEEARDGLDPDLGVFGLEYFAAASLPSVGKRT